MSPSASSSNVIDFIQPEKAKSIGTELETTTKALVLRFGVPAVVDQASCQQAVLDRQTIGAQLKSVDAFFEPFTSMADKLHKALTGRRAEVKAPLLVIDRQLQGEIGRYADEVDRRRRIEETRLAAEQRQRDADRVAAEAAELEMAGEHAMAAAAIDEHIAAGTSAFVLPDSNKEIEGLSRTRRYLWRLPPGKTAADVVVGSGPSLLDVVQAFVDKFPGEAAMEPLVLALAAERRLVARKYLCLDEKRIGGVVRNMKGAERIQGLELYHVDDPTR